MVLHSNGTTLGHSLAAIQGAIFLHGADLNKKSPDRVFEAVQEITLYRRPDLCLRDASSWPGALSPVGRPLTTKRLSRRSAVQEGAGNLKEHHQNQESSWRKRIYAQMFIFP